jgi:5-(carboxyamino)imidazole ribonucleotide synthase
MLAQSAHDLGYFCVVYDPDEEAPAGRVVSSHMVSGYDDRASLIEFGRRCDVVTVEFENIPDEALRILEGEGVQVRPGREVFAVARNRYREKQKVESCGLRCVPWRVVSSREELEMALTVLGEGGVVKAAEGGYDGKGQVRVMNWDSAGDSWKSLGVRLGVYESWIEDPYEISVIVGRNGRGELASFEATHNRHSDHILEMSVVPADISGSVRVRAKAMAEKLAKSLNLHGIMAVEMFVTGEGEILVNELAPRPHNSGHWTMDGAVSSQFRLLVSMICNLPVPLTDRVYDAEMINLLGEEIDNWRVLLSGDVPGRLYIYGKKEKRKGRKMGHFTRLFPRTD